MKGKRRDYRLVNLKGCVQLETRIRKGAYVEQRGDAGVERRDSQSQKAFALVFADLSCVGRSPSSSSSLARTVCLGVGERHEREIVIWSPQRPKAASNRLPVSVKSVRGHRPRRGLQARNHRTLFYFRAKSLFYVSLVFSVFYVHAGAAPIECWRSQWCRRGLKAIRRRIKEVI